MANLSNVELFIRVVEEGSFSATARLLGLTPSAVSRQISQLESELGARLFQRSTRRQSLTEAGNIYLQCARRVCEELDAGQLAVKRLTANPSGLLRMTAEADFALAFIEPLLPEFLALYPDIQLSLHMSTGFQDLIDSSLDLAIRIGHLEDSSLVARKLAQSHSLLCASPGYLAKYGTPKHPNELKSHSCLSFRTQPGINNWCFKIENDAVDVPINGRLSVNGLFFLRNAALNSMGIIMLPKWMICEELQQQRLLPVLQDFPIIPAGTPIHAIFANKRQLAPKVKVFVNFLLKRMRKI